MKRIKEPPPEFFRFSEFYNLYRYEVELCCNCDQEIRKGIHDLMLDLMYCFECAEKLDLGGGK